MNRIFSFAAIFALGALAAPHPLHAQETPGARPGKSANKNPASDQQNKAPGGSAKTVPYWKAVLPGGSYTVELSAIESVSTQQYIVDGMARVTELNIATAGKFQPRFYYIEKIQMESPVDLPGAQALVDRAQDLAENLAASSPPDDAVWAKVVKNYPTTTHAGTIEFRIESAEQLQQMARSAERAWISGKGEIYTIQGTRPFTANEVKKSSKEPEEEKDPDQTAPQE